MKPRRTGSFSGAGGDPRAWGRTSQVRLGDKGASLGLPVTYAPGHWDALATAMRRDKKARGSLLRFVVLDAVGKPTRLEGPDDAMLREAYACVSG